MSAEGLRFGLVGFGLFGAHHARSIAGCVDAELAGIVAKSQASRDKASNEFANVTVYEDYRQMIADDSIDVIDVVVPNHLHFEVAQAALAAGKHVLLEKPMALSVGECERLIETAAENNLVLAINHELRLSSLWRGMKELLDEKVIGKPRFAMVELSRFPYRQGAENWRYDPQRVGNWILEEPIHFFDLARWYLQPSGDPVSVFAKANACDVDRPDLTDHFTALVSHTDGAYALVSQSLAAFEHHVTVKIGGERGMMWGWWSAADARSPQARWGLRYGLGEQISDVRLVKPTGELLELADQIDAMVQAVQTGEAPPCTGNDGMWSTKLCLAAAESAASGETVGL